MIDEIYKRIRDSFEEAARELEQRLVCHWAVGGLRSALADARVGGTAGDLHRLATDFDALAATVVDTAPNAANNLRAAARSLRGEPA